MDSQKLYSFFKALNPTSTDAGVIYGYDVLKCKNDYQRLINEINSDVGSIVFNPDAFHVKPGDRMMDETVWPQIKNAYSENLDFMSGLERTFEIIIGDHYDTLNEKSPHWKKGTGRKGALDYLFFPLVARKLIFDTYPIDEQDQINKKPIEHAWDTLVFMIAIPLEITRLAVALALTLLLIPAVFLMQFLPHQTHRNPATNPSESAPARSHP